MKFFTTLLTITAATAAVAAAIGPLVTTDVGGVVETPSVELLPRGKDAWAKAKNAVFGKMTYNKQVKRIQKDIGKARDPKERALFEKELEIVQAKGPNYIHGVTPKSPQVLHLETQFRQQLQQNGIDLPQ